MRGSETTIRAQINSLQGRYELVGVFIEACRDPEELKTLGEEAGKIKRHIEALQQRDNLTDRISHRDMF